MARLRLVSLGKIVALLLFIAVGARLAVYFVHHKRDKPGVEKPGLKPRATAHMTNTRYTHEVDGKTRFVLTAGVDEGYDDGTHQLEQVKLESHGVDGKRNDVITADRGTVSDTSNLTTLTAEFISNVQVATTEGLLVKTSYLKFDQSKNTVETPERVDFESNSMFGHSIGALIETEDQRAHLLKDADVTIKAESDTKSGKDIWSKDSADKAAAKQTNASEKPETEAEREARKARKRARKEARRKEQEQQSGSKSTSAAASSAKAGSGSAARAEAKRNKKAGGKQAEPGAEGANLASASGDDGAANGIDAKETRAEKPAPSGKKGAIASKPKSPVHITGDSALLEKKDHRVSFTGNVVVTKVGEEMRADKMAGFLDDKDKVQRIEARGNSYIREDGKAEVKSPDMDFFFGEGQTLQRAVAVGGVYAQSLSGEPSKEARSDSAEVLFVESAGGNVVDTLNATGNADVQVHAPPQKGNSNPAERELKATNVSLHFYPDGKNIRSAEAHGNAVMTVLPTRAEKKADKKKIIAPNMEATFFEDGNRIQDYHAEHGVKVEFETQVANGHPLRTTTSDRLTAKFEPDSQDVDRLTQEGNFQYEEGDRHGKAQRAIFDGQSQLLYLRGGRPEAWDTKGRTLADEIDYDRGKNDVHSRGDVRTTYYNPGSAGEATPFKKRKSPVYITGDRADAIGADNVAIYTGKARGWQDDNFVSGDRIELFQDEKKMIATGHVESALYKVEKGNAVAVDKVSDDDSKKNGKKEKDNIPGFATADQMTYTDDERKVHYEGNVKARHGSDNIDASTVDVYMKPDVNEILYMIAEGSVQMRQPGRRGAGDKLTYTAADDRGVLTGRNAWISDETNGSTMGAQLTFHHTDDKIEVEKRGADRVRSVHRPEKKSEKTPAKNKEKH